MPVLKPYRTLPARTPSGSQLVMFLRNNYTFGAPGLVALTGTVPTLILGKVPAGADIMQMKVRIIIAVAGLVGGSLSVGFNAPNYNNLIQGADSDITTIGSYLVTRGLSLDITADQEIHAAIVATSGTITAGSLSIVIPFVPNADIR